VSPRSSAPSPIGQIRKLALLVLAALFVAPAVAHADALSTLTDPVRRALEGGSFGLALLLIFGAGLLTSLTPCVYPMIAITVSVFGAREAKSRREGALLSLAFVLGIAALFTPLGVISALTGAAMGSTNANAWVMVPLAVLFGAMAISMFGAFDLQLPDALQSRLVQVGGSGYRGAFLIGFVNGLVAAPCTGPVLTVLLSWVATTRNVPFGALALFVYSLGLGVLFFVVGTFAVSLPKSGRWLDSVKSIFGVIMLALAIYYVKRFIPIELPPTRNLPWIIGSLVVLVFGLGVGAVHLSFKSYESTRAQRVRKAVGVVAATLGIVSAIAWVEALPAGARIAFQNDYEAARSEALSRGVPLLVDFGADWCNACKELDHEAMSDARVVAEAGRFVAVRVDLSASVATPARWALLRRYRQPGLPLVVMHHSDGREAARVTGPVGADEFLGFLRQAR
jgi:thiol:disulfide interchange protein DsbD